MLTISLLLIAAAEMRMPAAAAAPRAAVSRARAGKRKARRRAAKADPQRLIARATQRYAVTAPTDRTHVRHRVAAEAPAGPDEKTRALNEDGVTCSIVGARVCTSEPRTIVAAPIGI